MVNRYFELVHEVPYITQNMGTNHWIIDRWQEFLCKCLGLSLCSRISFSIVQILICLRIVV